MHGTTAFEELKVSPETDDKRRLVIAMLGNQLIKEVGTK